MGMDCKIYLPHNIRVDDVASVIGACLGCPKSKQSLSTNSWVARVNGASVLPSAMPELCIIRITNGTVDDQSNWTFHYHFECHRLGRLIMPRSFAVNIALGKRLVNFFGGILDYNDYDDSDVDYEVKCKDDKTNRPEDGEQWDDLQRRIFDTPPLTEKEILDCVELSAYQA